MLLDKILDLDMNKKQQNLLFITVFTYRENNFSDFSLPSTKGECLINLSNSLLNYWSSPGCKLGKVIFHYQRFPVSLWCRNQNIST